MSILPGTAAPALDLPLVGGGRTASYADGGSAFTLVAFYRGYHCPKCRDQLQEMREKLSAFHENNVSVIALSMDDEDRASTSVKEWELGDVPVAYDLTEAQARAWGLFISASIGKTSMGVEESAHFNEPGIFLVRPDGKLFASWVQTVPLGRPHLDELIGFVKFVASKDYPARGTVAA